MPIHWRPELNALTTPPSYRARVIPQDTVGYAALAERIVLKNPVCSVEQAESVLRTADDEIAELLIAGHQVALENAFTYHLTITARLDSPDDPLPPDSTVNVQAFARRQLVDKVRLAAAQPGNVVREAPETKLPVIAGVEDTVLDLNDVLNPDGVLRLSGTDLLFDPKTGTGQCLLEGTRDGSAVQTRFAMVSNTLILVVPEIPSQPDPWNNEYRVSVSTHYTVHGNLRTGVYARPLRTPLAISLATGGGILSGSETSPLVRVTGGVLGVEFTRVRIQAVINAQDGQIYLRLLDMSQHGVSGDAVPVPDNGIYTLPGYEGSPLTSLEVTVDDHAALEDKLREEYTGWMVDILDLSQV